MQLGELKEHTLEDGEIGYGLYVGLEGRPVFVDIRRDANIEARKMFALALWQNSEALAESLSTFKSRNKEYIARNVLTIGIHADDAEQGEVFWEPDGYTQLRGLSFLDP